MHVHFSFPRAFNSFAFWLKLPPLRQVRQTHRKQAHCKQTQGKRRPRPAVSTREHIIHTLRHSDALSQRQQAARTTFQAMKASFWRREIFTFAGLMKMHLQRVIFAAGLPIAAESLQLKKAAIRRPRLYLLPAVEYIAR